MLSDEFCPFNTANGLGNVFTLWFEVFYCEVLTLFTYVDEAEKDFVWGFSKLRRKSITILFS